MKSSHILPVTWTSNEVQHQPLLYTMFIGRVLLALSSEFSSGTCQHRPGPIRGKSSSWMTSGDVSTVDLAFVDSSPALRNSDKTQRATEIYVYHRRQSAVFCIFDLYSLVLIGKVAVFQDLLDHACWVWVVSFAVSAPFAPGHPSRSSLSSLYLC